MLSVNKLILKYLTKKRPDKLSNTLVYHIWRRHYDCARSLINNVFDILSGLETTVTKPPMVKKVY
jgi:hypothetical protein